MTIQKYVRQNIRDLKPYSSARDEFDGRAEIYLDANENPFESGLNRYPDPLQKELKSGIAELKSIKPQNIFLGNGSDEAIDLLIRIFCEPGRDEIVVLPPTYGMYSVCAAISNVSVREVPLKKDFQPDADAILEASSPASKILFLCSPNNPTGNHFKRQSLLKLIAEFDGIVVVDEAYIDFSEKESCLNWIDKYPNLVVLQTFSKAWGLAGIRLGMAFASEEIIRHLNKVKPPYNVNVLSQNAALSALNKIEDFQKEVAEIIQQRESLKETLMTFDFVQGVFPSSANFLLTKVLEPKPLFQFLIEKNIIVRNRSKVLLCENCLRISVGTAIENQQLLEALKLFTISKL